MRKMYAILVLFILVAGGVVASGCLGGEKGTDKATGTQTQTTNAGGSVEKNGTSTATNTATNTLSEEEIEKKVEEWMKYNYLVITEHMASDYDIIEGYYIVPIQTSGHKINFTIDYNVTGAHDILLEKVKLHVETWKQGYVVTYNVTIFNFTSYVRCKDVDIQKNVTPVILLRFDRVIKENGKIDYGDYFSPTYVVPAENVSYDAETDTYTFVATVKIDRWIDEFQKGIRVWYNVLYNPALKQSGYYRIYILDEGKTDTNCIRVPRDEYTLIIPQDAFYDQSFRTLFEKIATGQAYKQGTQYDYAVYK